MRLTNDMRLLTCQYGNRILVLIQLALSPCPIFANFTERMTERSAKIGPGFHCRGIGTHALEIIQNLYNQDIQNP